MWVSENKWLILNRTIWVSSVKFWQDQNFIFLSSSFKNSFPIITDDYFWKYQAIGLMSRVLANGPGDCEVQSNVKSYQGLKNGTWYLLA